LNPWNYVVLSWHLVEFCEDNHLLQYYLYVFHKLVVQPVDHTSIITPLAPFSDVSEFEANFFPREIVRSDEAPDIKFGFVENAKYIVPEFVFLMLGSSIFCPWVSPIGSLQ
jgi:hypothetical protein